MATFLVIVPPVKQKSIKTKIGIDKGKEKSQKGKIVMH